MLYIFHLFDLKINSVIFIYKNIELIRAERGRKLEVNMGEENKAINKSYTKGITATSTEYTDANSVRWKCGAYKQKTIIVKNTGNHSMTMRIRFRAVEFGEPKQLQEATVPTGGETDNPVVIYMDRWYYDIEIHVKNNSGVTSCIIDYGGTY